jgi:HEAT repeat protein
MWAIEDVLRSRGREARLLLVTLLDQKDRFVRYYAAQALLGLVPERARAVIEWTAEYWFDAIAGDARGLLRAFDTGKYKPD